MAKLFLASNFVLMGGGHLQIVYLGDDAVLQEVEMQGPGLGFFGSWVYPPFGRDHIANTPHFGERGLYKSVEIAVRNPEALWLLVGQVEASLAGITDEISYEFGQNSNSFVNTVLWAVGLDLSRYKMTTGSITFFPGDDKNVLLGANTRAGPDMPIALSVALTGYDDVLHCGIGDDEIGGVAGTEGGDRLWLGAGIDVARVGAGRDWLIGEAGRDDLYGGGGADRFVFASVRESHSGQGQDVIHDLQGRDVIDLHQMDANRDQNGNQQFTCAEAPAAYSVWLVSAAGDRVFVRADVTGDAKADLGLPHRCKAA